MRLRYREIDNKKILQQSFVGNWFPYGTYWKDIEEKQIEDSDRVRRIKKGKKDVLQVNLRASEYYSDGTEKHYDNWQDVPTVEKEDGT